jgi:predicted permease
MQTVLISLPIFLIIFSGWFFRKVAIVDKTWVTTLNGFAYYIALPSLIVSSFLSVDFFDSNTWTLAFESITIVILFSLFVFLVLLPFKMDRGIKNAVLLGSMVGNTVFLGFPLIEINFGVGYLSQSALIGSFLLIVPILLAMVFIQHQNVSQAFSFKREFFEFIKNPLVLSVVVGVLLSLLHPDYVLFESITKTLSMLGSTASPIALFALGAFLCGKSKNNIGILLLVSFFKLLVFPLGAILVSLYVFKQGDVKVLTLLSSMPVAVTTFVIAEKCGLDEKLIGDSILVSTILSFFVVPIIVFFFV